jgi:hypothetical protein
MKNAIGILRSIECQDYMRENGLSLDNAEKALDNAEKKKAQKNKGGTSHGGEQNLQNSTTIQDMLLESPAGSLALAPIWPMIPIAYLLPLFFDPADTSNNMV